MKSLLLLTFCLFLTSLSINAQNYKIIESNSDYIKIEFNFENKYSILDTLIEGNKFQYIEGDEYCFGNPGDPYIPGVSLNLGIPFNSNPQVKILSLDQQKTQQVFLIPYPDSLGQPFNKLNFNDTIYNSNNYFPRLPADIRATFVVRYARIAGLMVFPYQFNPITRELIFNKKITLRIEYSPDHLSPKSLVKVNDQMTDDILRSSVINVKEAVSFTGKAMNVATSPTSSEAYWYDPQKDYYKIYLTKKGLFRITHDYLIEAGVPVTGLPLSKLELINNGESIPIDIVDSDSNDIFTSGDYFQFIGYPPSPTPYNTSNIYNLSNVYWFSYENTSEPIRYQNKNGFPKDWTNTYQSNLTTIHYEEDLINEKLGYANDDKRDFWYWGKASAESGNSTQSFTGRFPTFQNFILDSSRVTLRVNMHGMTTTSSSQCFNNHKAYISITDEPVGSAIWSNQNSYTFEKTIYISKDSIKIYPTGNTLNISVKGDACPTTNSDEIRINWFEFEYWKENRTSENNFSFQCASPYLGINRFWLYSWQRNNMKIYIPQRGEIISNPQIVNDEYKSVLFVDTLSEKTEYFCASDDYFFLPDSIIADQSSDIRNTSNGADYIIITHPKFISAAQKLSDFRSSNLTGFSAPRTKIVDVNEIYDEFSFGLVDPNSLQRFVKYAFDNWQAPSPAYIAIIGDMSSDYRKIMNTSRSNYVPSILYFSRTFGHVPSDNLIVDVVGNDLYPDLAIGRLSCETVEEANTLVDKIINYPADNSKAWQENILFLASGLSESDQINFGFNDSSKALERDFLLPNGFTTSKVFNYPDPKIPEDLQFKGSGPKMREELNKGAVVANYYGHGGGGQWDLIFTNDDILELNNGNKLPLVLSVTCYTAQFDNQECFGEIFVKTPGKGAIGFLGSTGLTYWGPGTILNRKLYEQIFSNKNYVIGRAILNAKSSVGGFNDMIAQLTYFGDPALELALPKHPDFEIKSSDISITPENPSKNDTILIRINVRNLGILFSDSVTVEVYKNTLDISNLIGAEKLAGFGQNGSALVRWIPEEAGLYNLIVRINETDPITEIDHSDNFASASFAVFDLSEPGIVKPIDGFSSSTNNIEFILADISENVGKNLFYFFEIDTSFHFSNPLIKSQGINPQNGIVSWLSPNSLSNGIFFWRVRISDGENFSNWSTVRSFSVIENPKDGYFAFDNILKTFESNNLNYSESDKSLQLNLSLLPPRPSNETFIEDIIPNTTITDSVGMTTITTDGSYLYFGNIWYYAQNYNSGGKSFIYKIGTGNNGTVKGEYYGIIPNFYDKISFQIFYHSDGFLYAALGDPYHLKKINPNTGDTSSVFIPDGILDGQTGKPTSGSYYITSDGNYVYNLALFDSLGVQRYMLRTFNPSDNWNLLRPDIQLTSASYFGFSGFFAAEGYVYPHENYFSGFMRRIRANDGFFEEEWITFRPFKSYYAWCWDWQNNKVYASVYRSNFAPKISKFEGKYQDARGSILTSEIGPALKWNQVSYEMESNGSAGSYNGVLFGFNKNTNLWDTLNANLPPSYSLVNLDAPIYNKLKMRFDLRDTTFGVSTPMKFKSVNVSYVPLPEIVLTRNNLTFQPDSILQGFPINVTLNVMNVGYAAADSLQVDFYLNDSDSVLHRTNIDVPVDTLIKVEYTIQTDQLSPQAFHKIKAIASLQTTDEYYVYNNIIDKNFFVLRDSIKPVFTITVDGKEIVNGDIVSAKPEILITLKDDSPLPLDTSLFTIIYNNVPLAFNRADVQYTYTSYPNSESKIRWTPDLPDGKHTLEVLAKDASGNFFDTTSSRTVFYVYNQPNLLYVYNYPNPFKNDTYFTFELRGTVVPDEFLIKIYTVAGRLIKEITVPSSAMNIGFNRIYWDGRDEDGDEISNGIYFYKIISRLNNETKVITEKLAKVK